MNTSLRTPLIIIALILLIGIAVVGLGSALIPLVISFGLAYLVFPLIKQLEERGLPRAYAVSGIFALTLSLIILILILVLPGLFEDGRAFLKELPQTATVALDKVDHLAEDMGFDIDVSQEGVKEFINLHISEISTDLVKTVTKSIRGTFSNIFKWLLSVLNLFLIPLFFFYVINDFERISTEIKSFIPPSANKKLSHYLSLSNRVLSGYIRGQLLVAGILSLLYGFGLWMVGLRFGFLIGFVSGLISVIPYAGLTLGITTALMMGFAYYEGLPSILGIIGVFVFVQTLEGFLITPKLVGDKVGLSALATILALIIGGNLLGLVGMLIAIPTAAVCKVILADLKKEYQALDVYKST